MQAAPVELANPPVWGDLVPDIIDEAKEILVTDWGSFGTETARLTQNVSGRAALSAPGRTTLQRGTLGFLTAWAADPDEEVTAAHATQFQLVASAAERSSLSLVIVESTALLERAISGALPDLSAADLDGSVADYLSLIHI